MADSFESRMNKASIKRVDPYVKEILATATHVALYKFNTSSCEWEKTDTEGALFIYSRNGEPFHSFMVMNRLNTDNVIEPIVKEFDCQMQNPFLLYRNSKSKIFGIWFFTRDECVKITYLIETIMESLKSTVSGDKSKKDNSGEGNTVNIFNLLTKAQEDFNKTPSKQPQSDEVRPPPAFSTPRDGTSKSVMDFFAKASTKSTQKAIPLVGDGDNVLQRLMSNPAHSVEHIEKQQRSVTPQEQIPLHQKQHSDRRSVPISFPSTSVTASNDPMNFMGISPPQFQGSSPLAFLLQGPSQPQEESANTRTSPFAQFLDNAQKPQLMTPMMFMTGDNVQNRSQSTAKTTENIDLLTEKQLAQALIHLLKTNSNFTRQIHEAYVNSIMEKVNCNTSGNSLI